MKDTLEIIGINEKKHQTSRHTDYEIQAISKQIYRKSYALSLSANIRDLALGISSLCFFSYKKAANNNSVKVEVTALSKKLKHLDEIDISALLDQIEEKHQTSISFFYPIMDPKRTNSSMISKTLLSIEKAKQKFDRYKNAMQCKSQKTNSAQRTALIDNDIEKQYNKISRVIDIYSNEISNRKKVLNILKQVKIPNGLKLFMEEINSLSIQHKQDLFELITEKKLLSPYNNQMKTAYELMFAYQDGSDDLVVGLRSNYDPDHPHPTLLGGINPSAVVAGTIDLYFDGQILKIATIRLDSGHYMPDIAASEFIVQYLKYSMNPKYYDNLALHNFDDEPVGVFLTR